jgi:uncharacterized protein (TIGR02145 family)
MKLGNITWSSVNADGNQTFAEKPDMYTKFYQWNRSTAWAATGTVSDWSSTADQSETWTVNPCPTGWRLPTKDEFTALIDAGNTWRNANEKGNAVAGSFFGPNSSDCSLASGGSMSGCVFLPASSSRNDGSGALSGQGSSGYYWSSTQMATTYGYNLFFGSSYVTSENGNDKASGFNVRCVK